MSKLEKLIAELCPDGVEYKQLGEVCKIRRGERVTKNELIKNGSYPVISGGEKPMGKLDKFNRTENTITIAQYGMAGYVNFIKTNFWANDVCFCLYPKENLNNKFLLHFLKNKQNFLYKISNRNAVPFSIDRDKILDIKIPVPPLPVQEEIVRILDTFSQLITELKAELKARKKQYEYYRDELYSKYESSPKKKLAEISNISRGVRVIKKQLVDDGDYPVYQNSLAPMGYYYKSNCAGEMTYVISAGAAGEIGFCDTEFWAADDCLVFSSVKEVRNKYIYYFLLTKQDYIRSNVRTASIPRLSRTVIENLQIPIISLQEQDNILSILDRFDALCNDISQGIPAEIEARQKQYEYYRDKLLTFKKLA